MTLDVNKDGHFILYEMTINVYAVSLKILFPAPPSLTRVCECISEVFASNQSVAEGMSTLVFKAGGEDGKRKFCVGDEIKFQEGDKIIGHMELQTRTLFDV